MVVQLDCHGISDIGARRRNEDALLLLPESGLFTIADGIGGNKAGNIASKLAINYFSNFMIKNRFLSIQKKKKQALNLINKALYNTNSYVCKISNLNNDLKGMGTTICCLCEYDSRFFYAHVGDSAIYLLRKNKLRKLTSAHCLKNFYSVNLINKKSLRNVITRAIGISSNVNPDISSIKYKKGDIFFLCTDGLSDYVSSNKIKLILQSKASLFDKSSGLIDVAKKNGSKDNITILILEVKSLL